MDWLGVARLIAPFAPTAGKFLGGFVPFPGASIVGGLLGSAVATALGVENTPDAVASVLQAMSPEEAAAKLAPIEAEAKAKWDSMARIAEAEAQDRTGQSQAINATMTAEVAKGQPWYAWRNIWGYSVTIECALVSMEILWELRTGDFKAINAFTSLSGFFLSWYGMRIGVLGYIFRGASNEKIAAVTGENPGVVGQIIKAVTKK